MTNRLVATGLVVIGLLASACTGSGVQARSATQPSGAVAPTALDAQAPVRGSEHLHAHHGQHTRVR